MSSLGNAVKFADAVLTVNGIVKTANGNDKNVLNYTGDAASLAGWLASLASSNAEVAKTVGLLGMPLVVATAAYKFNVGTDSLDTYADLVGQLALVTANTELAAYAFSFSLGLKVGGLIDQTSGKEIDAYVGNRPTEVGDAVTQLTGSSYLGALMAGATRAFGALDMLGKNVNELPGEAYDSIKGWLEGSGFLKPDSPFFKIANDYLKGVGPRLNDIVSSSHDQWLSGFTARVSPGIDPDVYARFTTSFRMMDPLIVDLDGDGVETVSRNQGVVFDHNGDGKKIGTGWVGKDDGLLVIDLNNNGLIDNGSELFGVNTLLKNGKLAVNGFEALRDLDSNGDGLFDKRDEKFSQVKVWQDLNQDGVSQAYELKTLGELNISAISVVGEVSSVNNAGNIISNVSTFYRQEPQDGSVRQHVIGSVDFAENTFFRGFSDPVALDNVARSLPGLRGSGGVRDLREASMLSEVLKSKALEFVETDATARKGLIENLLSAWAATSVSEGFIERLAHASSGLSEKLQFVFSWDVPGALPLASGGTRELTAAEQEIKSAVEKLRVLEAFTGTSNLTFQVSEQGFGETYKVSVTSRLESAGRVVHEVLSSSDGKVYVNESILGMDAWQISVINNNYNAFVASVYPALNQLIQLETYVAGGDKYFSDLKFDFSGNNALFDYSSLTEKLVARHKVDPVGAFIEANSLMKILSRREWVGLTRVWVTDFSPEQLKKINNYYVEQSSSVVGYTPAIVVGALSDDSLVGREGDDYLIGLSGADTLRGGGGADVLLGGVGDDKLHGEGGDDFLVGGEGNDYLVGGRGSDVYYFEPGWGQDVIDNYDFDGGLHDNILFGPGVHAANIGVRRSQNDLVFFVKGGSDSIKVSNFFADDVTSSYALGFVTFEGGEQWTKDDIKLKVLQGTDGTDYLRGYSSDDILNAGKGDDVIFGNAGDDRITGGQGDDFLVGGAGVDVYHFEIGDGNDVILESLDPVQGNTGQSKDSISFGHGIKASDLHFEVAYSADGVSMLQISYPGGVISVVEGMLGAIGTVLFADGVSVPLSSLLSESPVKASLGDLGHEFFGSSKNDEIKGGAGNDTIYGGYGADILLGGHGNDSLFGGAGDDLLDGGSGNDWLEGGEGNNKFVFSKYMGQDTWLTSAGSINTILVSEDIASSELVFERSGDDLIVKYLFESASNATLVNYFIEPGRWDISYAGASPQSLSQAILSGSVNPLSQVDYYVGVFKERVLGEHIRQLIADGYEGQGGLYSYKKVKAEGRVTSYSTLRYDVRYIEGVLQYSVGGMPGSRDENTVLSSISAETTEHNTFEKGMSYGSYYTGRNGGIASWTYKSSQLLLDVGEEKPGVDFINRYYDASSIITYSVVVGGDAGGRYNVQASNGYVGGRGDDKVVAYTFDSNNPIGQGVFLAGGGGNDTLVGSVGDDYLLGGAGINYLSGWNGRDTYVIDGDQTLDVVVDINIPVFDWGTGRWSYPESTSLLNDVVVMPGGVKFTDLSFSWGTEVVEDIDYYRLTSGYSGPSTDGIRVATQKTTLDIRWGTDHLVKVAMSSGTDPLGSGIEYFQFVNGERISTAELIQRASLGRVPDPRIDGMSVTYNGFTQLSTTDNVVSFSGGKGNDVIRSTHGDTIYGREGDDVLEGNYLVGGEGNDTFTVYKVSGKRSRGYFDGGAGDDTYFFGASDGGGEIVVGGGYDGVVFNEGVDLSRLTFHRQDNSLLILVDGDLNHSIAVANHFANTDSRLSYVKTSANEFLDFDQINSLLSPIPEPAGPILGTDGDDILMGTSGDDVISGGKGNDFLSGLGGSDVYEFVLGDGQDTIYNDAVAPDQEDDILVILGSSKFDIWLSRQDQSLVLDFLGGNDKITIQDWYADDKNKLDSILLGPEVLYSNQVDMLVEAMSSFGVPVSGSLELTSDQRERVDMIISHSWKSAGPGGGPSVPM